MEPKIWCKSHHFSTEERPTYDIGQKDSASGLVRLRLRAGQGSADILPCVDRTSDVRPRVQGGQPR